MLGRLKRVKRLLLDLPRYIKLAYCLALDPRVPARNKAVLGAALTLIVTPFVDIPLWIPVIGEMDALALSMLAAQLFITAAPAEVVEELEQQIRAGQSRFDRDVEQGRRVATVLSRRFGSGSNQLPRHQVTGVAVASVPGHDHTAVGVGA